MKFRSSTCASLGEGISHVFLVATSLLVLVAPSSTAAGRELASWQVGTTGAAAATPVTVPADFVMGPGDVLSVVFWRDKDMTVDVVVRPDGKISLPLLNDVVAAGRTPEQLRVDLTAAASKLIEEPNVTVVVKEIHSRLVYITGNVLKAGPYPIYSPINVLQLIAVSGGLLEYADAKNIVIMRVQDGKTRSFKFNYKDVIRQKGIEQNIQLVPGDTVVVP